MPQDWTNPVSPPPSPPQAQSQGVATGKGAGGLQALAAIWGGIQRGYQMRQYKEGEALYSQVQIAKIQLDALRDAIKQKGDAATKDDYTAYETAEKNLASATDELQKKYQPKVSGKGNPGAAQKVENGWNLFKRLVMGPKLQLRPMNPLFPRNPQGGSVQPPPGVGTFAPQAAPNPGQQFSVAPKSPDMSMNGIAPPPNMPPSGTQSAAGSSPQGQIKYYQGKPYRVVGNDPANPSNVSVEPVDPYELAR